MAQTTNSFLFKSLSVVLVFTVFFLTIAPVANARSSNDVIDEEAKEIAEVLEFLFEEATVKNELGDPVAIDIKKIEGKYGNMQEVKQLQPLLTKSTTSLSNEAPIQTYSTALDTCIMNKIKNGFGELVTGAILTDIIEYLQQGDYLSAGKKLVRAGVRGTPLGVGVTIYTYFFTCLATV
ncbi:hypothetical protein [Thalassobacillus sp. B23F22_16]|uniref:hypothetical protein n=1 Tax=Thalassobacillus sp. B23F22_16 TaxID=3459513 RepID=UPI00373EFF79